MIIKKFKKILSIILCILFAFTLSGCGGERISLSINNKVGGIFYFNEYNNSIKLNASFSDGTNRELAWESSNTVVAQVNTQGVVEVFDEGQTVIKVSLKGDTSIIDSFTLTTKRSSINVTNRPVGDIIDVNNYTTITLGAELLDPSLNGEFEWSSSNEKVLTVSSVGTLSVIGLGVSTITVCLKNNANVRFAFDVSVIDGYLNNPLYESFTTAKIVAGSCVGKMKITGYNLTEMSITQENGKNALTVKGNGEESFIVINVSNLIAGNDYKVKIEYVVVDGEHTFDVYRFDTLTTLNGQDGVFSDTLFANSVSFKLKVSSSETGAFNLKINSISFEVIDNDNINGGEDVFE